MNTAITKRLYIQVMAALPGAKNVLVLGGGDGLAVREILKYPQLESVTLIDLDPRMTQLFRDHSLLSNLNKKSLSNARVKIINEDAFIWLDKQHSFF
jgi:spermidine synthase